jgi:hypothetical protein
MSEVVEGVPEPPADPSPRMAVHGQERSLKSDEIDDPGRLDRLDAERGIEELGEPSGVVAVLLDTRRDESCREPPEVGGEPLGTERLHGPRQELLDLVPPLRHERARKLADLSGGEVDEPVGLLRIEAGFGTHAPGIGPEPPAQGRIGVKPRQEVLKPF